MICESVTNQLTNVQTYFCIEGCTTNKNIFTEISRNKLESFNDSSKTIRAIKYENKQNFQTGDNLTVDYHNYWSN